MTEHKCSFCGVITGFGFGFLYLIIISIVYYVMNKR